MHATSFMSADPQSAEEAFKDNLVNFNKRMESYFDIAVTLFYDDHLPLHGQYLT
jgi:hypothetical protein